MTCFSSIFKWISSRKQEEFNEEVSSFKNVKIYSYKILQKATDNFCLANKVGEGGFGCVYKGKLKDGELVAIKVLSSVSRQGVSEFLNELNVVSNIVHENLVSLHGCCVEGNHRILVYNYLENNSLAQTLYGSNNSIVQFSWITRKKICVGVARGLAFLHEVVQIVHRDIKAGNVLLDKDLTPKISDFGLAKLLSEDITHVTTKVAGTLGYLAPEYATRGQFTRKADIYSFGVLLLEITCGRININTTLPYDDIILLEKVWALYESGELKSIINASLNDDFDIDEACKFLKVGLLCTQDNPKLRPSMSTVVKILVGEINIDSFEVTSPGLITDVMDLKGRNNNQNLAPQILSPISLPFESSSIKLEDTTHASMSFTAIVDHA